MLIKGFHLGCTYKRAPSTLKEVINVQQVLTQTYTKLFSKLPNWTIGLLVVIMIAFISKFLGTLFPLIGNILFAILIGIAIRNSIGIPSVVEPGMQFTLKKLLKVSIVMLGVSLSITDILYIGQQSFLIILLSVVMGIGLTIWFGKLLGLDQKLSMLIGVGTSICGATAISAVKGIVESDENETAYAISTIVLFNLLAFFLYPLIGHMIGLTENQFGIWAGTAVHDTSSAVAVGYVYGNEAGQTATTVKLARTLFLLPVMLILPFMLRKNVDNRSTQVKKAFPWFVVWFLAVSIMNSFFILPVTVTDFIIDTAKFIIIMVMASVGLQVNLQQFIKLGLKPLLTGLFASLTVSIVSLLFIILFT